MTETKEKTLKQLTKSQQSMVRVLMSSDQIEPEDIQVQFKLKKTTMNALKANKAMGKY